jgi:hypothetical protein
MSTPFTSPTGRLVWGDPFTAQKVMDDKTNPPTPKRDASGAEIYEFAFGVAFAKNDPLWPAFRKLLKDADRAAWPQFHDVNGEVLPGVKFADKITDGDGLNTKGQARAKPGNGYAGHWVVKFATRFAPSVHYHDGRQWVQMVDKNQLKAGDYIQVNGTTASNGSQQSPGMHRNASMVALYRSCSPEEAIVKGPDANDAFSAPPAGATGPIAPPPVGPMPGPGPAAAPPLPPVTPPPAAPPVMSAPIMLPAANGQTYEAMKAAGWTDALLVQHGMMAQPVAVTPPAPPPAPIAAPPPPAAPPPAAPPPAPPAPPPAPGRPRRPAGGGQTYEAMIAAGWTDALLIQHGMMAP